MTITDKVMTIYYTYVGRVKWSFKIKEREINRISQILVWESFFVESMSVPNSKRVGIFFLLIWYGMTRMLKVHWPWHSVPVIRSSYSYLYDTKLVYKGYRWSKLGLITIIAGVNKARKGTCIVRIKVLVKENL